MAQHPNIKFTLDLRHAGIDVLSGFFGGDDARKADRQML
jgi:hypothetical protein